MRGTFRAVGTFETGPSIPAGLVAAVLLAVALVSYLATILLILAIVLAVILVLAALVLAGLFLLLGRRNPRDTALLAERAPLVHAELDARLRAAAAARAVPAAVENHYHLHLPASTDASGIDWAAVPVRDAAGFKEDRHGVQ